MGKPSRSKRSENVGKGKVTPMQVAFLVDRYLCDNQFSETRSMFRSEASSLISKSPVREVPKSLMTLDDILNEYVCLKEQKVMVDQEKVRLEQEKTRVQNLLQGMQDVMNAYNASAADPSPAIPAAAPTAPQSSALVPHQNNFRASPSGCPAYSTPSVRPVSLPFNKRVGCGNFATPSTSQSITRKRKGSEVPAPVSRKMHNKTANQVSTTNGTSKLPEADKAVSYSASEIPSEMQASANNCTASDSLVHGSSVAKCLFNKSSASPPINSTCLRTPRKQTSSQSNATITPEQEVTPQDVTPTNCTIYSQERITISPLKQGACYTVERSRLISSSSPAKSNLNVSTKRDHVKGRLNFDDPDMPMCSDAPTPMRSGAPMPMCSDATIAVDGSSTSPSGSEQETDLLDLDFPNLDLLGEGFSFSELLVDLDLGCEGAFDACLPQPSSVPIETASGSSPESRDGNFEPDQVLSEYRSTVTEVIPGKEMNTEGPDDMPAVKSVTQCIRILSPVKNCRQRVSIE